MATTAEEILRKHKIEGVDPNKQGRQYTICPTCSHDRHGFNRRAKCLAVNIDQQGVRFFCNHGGEPCSGGEFFDGRSSPSNARMGGRTYEKPKVSGYEAMHRTSRNKWAINR